MDELKISVTPPLRIGLSVRLMYPDATRSILPAKTIHYAEESLTNWIMSGPALVFLIPAVIRSAPHAPTEIRAMDFVNNLDGVVLQGGSDISPQIYGEQPVAPEWAGDPVRDRYELDLFHACLSQGKPVLGICRGCQLINIAFGGTLYQDLSTQVSVAAGSHRSVERYDENFHDLSFTPNTPLANLYPGLSRARINSIHHQAIKSLGQNLQVEAYSEPDQLVEAIRWLGASYVLGLQWHPEFIRPQHMELLDSRPILAEFLRACAAKRGSLESSSNV